MNLKINFRFLFSLFSLLLFVSSCQKEVPKAWNVSQITPVVLKSLQMELMIPQGFYYDSDLSADPEKIVAFIGAQFRVKEDKNQLFNMMVNQLIANDAGVVEVVIDTAQKKSVMIIFERDYVPIHGAEARNITLEFEKSMKKMVDKNPASQVQITPAAIFKTKHFLAYIRVKMDINFKQLGRVYIYYYVLSNEINSYAITVLTKEDVMYDVCVANTKMLNPAIKK
jgi:hypothetical protein